MTASSSPDNWLRTDETEEALLALRVTSENLDKALLDLTYWPWVILPLHNALQGFMVLALRGSNGLNVLTPESAAGWIAAYESGTGDYPELELDDFLNLYHKVKSPSMMPLGISRPFKPRGSQGWSIKKLNSLRNEFVHFVPKGWSLEVSGLPSIVEDCVTAIEYLAFESDCIQWIEPQHEATAKTLVANIHYQAAKLKKRYGA